MLVLPPELREKMLSHARAALPNEGCGLLGGVEEEGRSVIREAYCLTNTDASAEHFSMAPAEQFAAIADMRKKSLRLLGNFHSHPETPARPSDEDKRLAYDPALVYVIISLAGEEPVVKAFKIDKSAMSAVECTIVT